MSIAVVVAALVAFAPPVPPSGPTSRPAAEAAEAALAHWEAGRYAEARAAIARAYMIEPWPEYLYARAQIERAAGDCVAAREFYGLYLDADPPERGAALAREGIEACPVVPEVAPDEVDAPPPASTRRVDPLGVSLAALGGAGVVIGAGLYIGMATERRAAERAEVHDAFGDRLARARRLSVAASAVISVGAMLAIAGVVRLAIVARRGKARRPTRSPSSSITLAWTPGVGLRW